MAAVLEQEGRRGSRSSGLDPGLGAADQVIPERLFDGGVGGFTVGQCLDVSYWNVEVLM